MALVKYTAFGLAVRVAGVNNSVSNVWKGTPLGVGALQFMIPNLFKTLLMLACSWIFGEMA